jgi:hypothetical protein
MKFWSAFIAMMLGLALVALLGAAAAASAGQVPNPVNAPAAIAHAGDALIASGTAPQQAADSGLSLTSQSPNTVLAGPGSGGAGAPSFRALLSADVPAINLAGTGAGGVTGLLPNSGLANSSIGIAGAGVALGGTASFSPLIATLGSPVALNNTASNFDVVSVAQGMTGVFVVTGTATALAGATADTIACRIWDGTTTFAAARVSLAASAAAPLALSAIVTNPAGNLRLNCQDASSVNGSIEASGSGFGANDTMLSVFRIG